MNYLELKTWQDSHSSIYREIVSRFGQSDYNDEAKKKKTYGYFKIRMGK